MLSLRVTAMRAMAAPSPSADTSPPGVGTSVPIT
jgi:hypothetical protein